MAAVFTPHEMMVLAAAVLALACLRRFPEAPPCTGAKAPGIDSRLCRGGKEKRSKSPRRAATAVCLLPTLIGAAMLWAAYMCHPGAAAVSRVSPPVSATVLMMLLPSFAVPAWISVTMGMGRKRGNDWMPRP